MSGISKQQLKVFDLVSDSSPKRGKFLNEKHMNACVLLNQDQKTLFLLTYISWNSRELNLSIQDISPTLFPSLLNCQCKSYDENCMFCLDMMTILTEKQKTYFSQWSLLLSWGLRHYSRLQNSSTIPNIRTFCVFSCKQLSLMWPKN